MEKKKTLVDVTFKFTFTNIFSKYNINESITRKYIRKYHKEVYLAKYPDKAKYNYHLNFEDHWNMFLTNEKKYVELLSYNFLITDTTFKPLMSNDFSFVECFNKNVRKNLKRKIISDTMLHYIDDDCYGTIKSINDLVDINVFIQDPPDFLKDSNYTYDESNINYLHTFLEQIGYDNNKFNYKTYKLDLMVYNDDSSDDDQECISNK